MSGSIGGMSASAVALLILIILIARGGAGRVGIVLAAMAGTALGIAATLYAVFLTVGDSLWSVVAALGGAFG